MRRLAICSSVHHSSDARVTFREGRVLARAFDATLWLLEDGEDFEVDAGEGRALTVRRLGAPKGRGGRFLSAGRLLGAARAEQPDALLIHDPELVPRVWLGRTKGLVAAYDVHEDYPSMMLSKSWVPRPFRGPVSAGVDWVERSMVPSIGVVTVADSFLAQRFHQHEPPPVLVRNYPPLDLFPPGLPASERGHVLAYVGGITSSRGSLVMLEAFARVRESVADATFLLIGPLQDGSLSEVPEGVVAFGRMSYAEIGSHLSAARVGMAVLTDTPKYRRNIPSKLFDYMAAGVPFVTSDFPNITEACDGEGGLFVPPDDVEAIASAIVTLLTDGDHADRLQAQGLAAVRDRYNFDAEGARLVAAIEDALAK